MMDDDYPRGLGTPGLFRPDGLTAREAARREIIEELATFLYQDGITNAPPHEAAREGRNRAYARVAEHFGIDWPA